jgi:hypothetical protein
MSELKKQVTTAVSEINSLADTIKKKEKQQRIDAIIRDINNMLARSYFDICVIRTACEAYGTSTNSVSFEALAGIHCVNFSDMSPTIRQSIPLLIVVAIAGEAVAYGLEDPIPGKPDPLKVKGYVCPRGAIVPSSQNDNRAGSKQIEAELGVSVFPPVIEEQSNSTPVKKRSFWKFIFGDLLKPDPE